MSFFKSILPVLALVLLLILNILVFGDNATSGPNQLALLFAAAFAISIGYKNFGWKKLIVGIEKNITVSLQAIIILLLIGSLIGTWVISGIVPAMIYYGLYILNASFFLVSCCIICIIVSLATGSSWSTSGTIGIAMLGIGKALGFSEPVIVGAIISGAYFGDKMSPLSDTTNLAAAMAGSDLFKHIRYMTITTIPSIAITIIIFIILGLSGNNATNETNVSLIQQTLSETFNITPVLFIVPLVILYLIYKKVPTIPVIFLGMLLAGFLAAFFQTSLIEKIASADKNIFHQSYQVVIEFATTGSAIETSDPVVNELLKVGGMKGMLNTVWLIICAMIFGGAMEATGMLKKITNTLIAGVNSFFSLVSSTVGTCLFFNVTASDQYLSVVVPGKMFAEEYKKRGYAPENLSRTLEDSGTVTSVIIPWNTCGAYHSGLFGVSTFAYLPYCFFNIISPFMTLIVAGLAVKIKKIKN